MKLDKSEVESNIRDTSDEYGMSLSEEDITSLAVAYIKRGDIDLAVNSKKEVLSDLMEGEELDLISDSLDKTFGQQIKYIPSQIIPVVIMGRSYDTYLDDYGNQRFVGNRIIKAIAREMQSNYLHATVGKESFMNLDYIHQQHAAGEFSLEELIDLYVSVGTSLKYFRELEEFRSMLIVNPHDSHKG